MSKYKLEKSEAEWKAQLSTEEYRILRQVEQNILLRVNTTTIKPKAPNCKGCGTPLYNSPLNLTAAFDGLLMTKV